MKTIHITPDTPNPLKLDAGDYLLVYPDGMTQKEHVPFGSSRNIWFQEEDESDIEQYPLLGVRWV